MSATWNEQMHCYEPSCDFHQAEHSVFVPPSPPGDVEWIHCLPWCCGAFVKSSTPWPVFYSFLSLDLRHHDAPESTFFTKTSCKTTWLNKSINPKSHEQIGFWKFTKKHPQKKLTTFPWEDGNFPFFQIPTPKKFGELRGSTKGPASWLPHPAPCSCRGIASRGPTAPRGRSSSPREKKKVVFLVTDSIKEKKHQLVLAVGRKNYQTISYWDGSSKFIGIFLGVTLKNNRCSSIPITSVSLRGGLGVACCVESNFCNKTLEEFVTFPSSRRRGNPQKQSRWL